MYGKIKIGLKYFRNDIIAHYNILLHKELLEYVSMAESNHSASPLECKKTNNEPQRRNAIVTVMSSIESFLERTQMIIRI